MPKKQLPEIPKSVVDVATNSLRMTGVGCPKKSAAMVKHPLVMRFLAEMVAVKHLHWEQRDLHLEPHRREFLIHLRRTIPELYPDERAWRPSPQMLAQELEHATLMHLQGATA